jgi:hypothetical protein
MNGDDLYPDWVGTMLDFTRATQKRTRLRNLPRRRCVWACGPESHTWTDLNGRRWLCVGREA